jgi:Zn-dependent protease
MGVGNVGQVGAAGGVPGGAAPPVDLGLLLERQYQEALARIRNPKRIGQGLLLVGSLVAFMLVRSSSDSLRSVVVLIGILLFHELGHYVGMRMFGYRDVRMFFIPFFGAAVSGKKIGVDAWKDGVVTLLGPVPGILVAFILGAQSQTLSPATYARAMSMVSINAFNLLPLAGLDGARLLQLLLFSRHRWLELGFQACAGVAAGLLAINWHSIALGILAYFMVMLIPYRKRVLGGAKRLRDKGLALPPDPTALDGDVGRAVFLEAREAVNPQYRERTPNVAAAMEQLLDAATARHPSVGASLALGFALLVSFVLAAAALFLLVQQRAH